MFNYKLYEDNVVRIILALSCVMFCYNFFYWDYMSMYHQICDDAYISLKYAYNLYNYGELNYYPGYKVEGYTNFLWTVLISFAYVLNIEPVAYVKFLGFLSGIGLIFVVYLLAVTFFENKLTASILALAIGINSQIAYMSSWGLETTFYIFLYTLASLCYARNQLILSSLIIALSAMTRLEILPFFTFLLFFDYIKYKDLKRSIKLILPFSFLFVPYFYGRYLYYGYLLPNTFYVKVGSGMAFIQRGIDYIYYNLHKLNILYPILFSFFIIFVGTLYHIKNKTLKKIFRINPLKATFLTSCIFYTLYIIKVGGDVFGERFIVHYIIFYLFSILFLVDYIEKYRNINQYSFSVLILFSLLLTAPSFPNSTHLTGWVTLGNHIKSISSSQNTLATDAAGALAYYSELNTYDILGLNDVYIAHKEIKNMGAGTPGHEKQDNQYILNKKPTFITTWIDPDGGAGRGFKNYFDFLANYELITLLDTSRKEISSDRLFQVNNITSQNLLQLISRENKNTGIYDWALYKRKKQVNQKLEFKNALYLLKTQLKHASFIDGKSLISENKKHNERGYLLYGPYMILSLGKYSIDFEIEANNIENEILANFDIFIGGKVIKEKLFTKSELNNNIINISIPFEIDSNIENKLAEFRFYYFPNSDLTINFIHLNKI
jgi:arabinofuranosyltransferase